MKMTNGIFKKIFIFSILFAIIFDTGTLIAQETKSPYAAMYQGNYIVEDISAYNKTQETLGELEAKLITNPNDPEINKQISNSKIQAESYSSRIKQRLDMNNSIMLFESVAAQGIIAKNNKKIESIQKLTTETSDPVIKEKYTEALKASEQSIEVANKVNDTAIVNTKNDELRKQQEENSEGALGSFDCPYLWKSRGLQCIIANYAYLGPYQISLGALSASGKLFDYIVGYSIIDMKSHLYGQDGKNTSLDTSWKIFRDLANILFIFSLIYIAINTILSGTGETGKQIGTVIIVAVLINFSMFFSKVVIDITNTAAISFYNIIIEDNGDLVITDSNISDNPDRTIAEAIIRQSGVASSFNVPRGKLDFVSVTKQVLLTALIFLVLAVILIFASILLLTRFVILIVVILTSSLAFGAYIFPKLRSQITDKWWSALIGQSFVAPVFLLMLYIAFSIMKLTPLKETSGNGFGDFFNLHPEVLMKYFLTLALMIFAIKTAKSLSDKAGGMAGTITKTIGGVALGGLALAARGGIGGIGGNILKKMAGDGDGLGSRIARSAGNKLTTSSFDLRNSKTFQKVGDYTGVDVGKGGGEGGIEKGFKQWRENDKVWTGSAALNLLNPNEKIMKEQVALQEKRYKDATKYTKEQQEAVTAAGEFRNKKENIPALKVKALADRKAKVETALASIPVDNNPDNQSRRAQLTKKIGNLDKELAKQDMTIEDATQYLSGAGWTAIEAAETAATNDAKARGKKFTESRKSVYGRQWLKEKREKDAKEKKDTDDVVSQLAKLEGKISNTK